MHIFISFSMYFLSFVPLWITILFIDIKSIVGGGGDKWTEIIGIAGILLGLTISAIILFAKFFVIDDEKYKLTIQDYNCGVLAFVYPSAICVRFYAMG